MVVLIAMARNSRHFMNPRIEKKVYDIFINSVKSTKSSNEVIDFLNDLLSSPEQVMLAKRVSIAFLILENKYTYQQISGILKVSFGTIAKVHATFALKGKGYRKTIGNILLKKDIKNALSEFIDILTPLPPKGANIGEWKKSKRELKRKIEEPL